jgi:uncharacterized protein
MEDRPEPAATDQVAACRTPSRGFLAAVRHRLEGLVTHDTDPRRTAAALALGVFLSFSPLLGLQILIGFSAALALRLSRVAMLVGLCANLPWIMIPWYAITTGAAAAILGLSTANLSDGLVELFAVPVWRVAFWGRGADLVGTFFWPFLIGPFAGALVLGAIAYIVGLRFLNRRLERIRTRGVDAPSTGLAGDAEQRAADRHVHDAQRPRFQP